jgi:hypothetical protein
MLIGVNDAPFQGSHNQSAIAALGCDLIRYPVQWSNYETASGTYSGSYETAIATDLSANDAVGLKTLMTVVGAPSWSNGGIGQFGVPTATLSTFSGYYATMMAHAVTNHPGRVWELWNEADGNVYLLPNGSAASGTYDAIEAALAACYVSIVQAAYTAMKAADPTCIVVAGALASIGHTNFYDHCVSLGMVGYYDIFSIHLYNDPPTYPDPTLAFAAALNTFQADRAASGDTTPLWVTEFGWPAYPAAYQGTITTGVNTAPAQSSLITNFLQGMKNRGDIAAAIYFKYSDSRAAPVDGTDSSPPYFFGLADFSSVPKDSYYQLRSWCATNRQDSKHFGVTMPGYSNPANWGQSYALAEAGVAQSYGANWWVLQTTYNQTTYASTSISSSTAPSDANIIAQIKAAKALGMKIALKPHVVPNDGNIQDKLVPGGWSTANGATYTASSNVLTVPSGITFDSTYVGKRVLNPNPGHYNDIPTNLDSSYGLTAPVWTTISTYVSPTQVEMSQNSNVSTTTGSLTILDDTAVLTWFANYTVILDHLMTLGMMAGGVDLLDISTEHDIMTLVFDAEWRTLIAHLRATWPGTKLTIGMGGLDGYASVHCWDVLDYIGVTMYKNVQASGGGENYETIVSNWVSINNGLSLLSAAWNKLILFEEIGYRSIPKAGYSPESTGAGTAFQPDQAACVMALLASCWHQPYIAGIHWWTADIAQNTNPLGEATSYSFYNKLAGQAFATFFDTANQRSVAISGVTYHK